MESVDESDQSMHGARHERREATVSVSVLVEIGTPSGHDGELYLAKVQRWQAGEGAGQTDVWSGRQSASDRRGGHGCLGLRCKPVRGAATVGVEVEHEEAA